MLIALAIESLGGQALVRADQALARRQPEQAVTLECRRANRPWTPCRIGIEQIGSRWWIEIGDQRIRFEHDGSGQLRMKTAATAKLTSVQPNWGGEQVLCWGSLCARGALPLD